MEMDQAYPKQSRKPFFPDTCHICRGASSPCAAASLTHGSAYGIAANDNSNASSHFNACYLYTRNSLLYSSVQFLRELFFHTDP